MTILSSVGHDVIVSALAMAVLASLAVCFRFIAKNMTKSGVRADDYWALVGLIALWAYVGVILWGMFAGADGAGQENLVAPKYGEMKILLISLRSDIPLFATAMTPIKISILCLYRRLFSASLIKHGTLALGVICLIWWVAIILGSTFSCFWQSALVPHCIDFNIYYVVGCVAELIIDILILCLPLREISGLHVSLRDKVILFLTFLVGGFVCVTAIIRLGVTYRPHHNNIDLIRGMVWDNVQLGTAILCACLPTYRPLLMKCAIIFPPLLSCSRSSRIRPSYHRVSNEPRPQTLCVPNEPVFDSRYNLVQLPAQSHQFRAHDDQVMPTYSEGRSADHSADGNSVHGKKGPLRPISVNDAWEIV